MIKVVISLFALVLLSSCSDPVKEKENKAWDYLYNNEIDKSYALFKEISKSSNTSKKNCLGLAYTQGALKKDNYESTLAKCFDNKIIDYNFLVESFIEYYKNKDTTDFKIAEFKAFNDGGKFKSKKESQIVEGEYRDLLPYGVWKFYDLEGKLIREVDANANKASE